MPWARSNRTNARKTPPGSEPPWRLRSLNRRHASDHCQGQQAQTAIAMSSAGGRSSSRSGCSSRSEHLLALARSGRSDDDNFKLQGCASSRSRSSRAACSGSSAPAIARSTTSRRRQRRSQSPAFSCVYPTDREERHRRVRGGVADELQAHGRATGLGRASRARPNTDVVDQLRVHRVDLLPARGSRARSAGRGRPARAPRRPPCRPGRRALRRRRPRVRRSDGR